MNIGKYSFKCRGHKNIKAMHKKTLEFTADSELSPAGDCIVGVGCDFSLEELKKNLVLSGSADIVISTDNFAMDFSVLLNPSFCSHGEIVFRRSGFISDRTLGTRASASASDLDPLFVASLKNPGNTIRVDILQ